MNVWACTVHLNAEISVMIKEQVLLNKCWVLSKLLKSARAQLTTQGDGGGHLIE